METIVTFDCYRTLIDFDLDFSILAVIVEGAAEAALVLKIKGNAGFDGKGIDMQAHAARFCGVLILDLVNALHFVHAVDGAALCAVVGGEPVKLNVAGAAQAIHSHHVLVLRTIAGHILVIVDRDLTLGELPQEFADLRLLP